MNDFKEKFNRNFRLASERFHRAIDEIDKTIDHLQKTKEALLSSENKIIIRRYKKLIELLMIPAYCPKIFLNLPH